MENIIEHEMKTLRPRKGIEGIVGAVLGEDMDFCVIIENQMDKKSENRTRNSNSFRVSDLRMFPHCGESNAKENRQ